MLAGRLLWDLLLVAGDNARPSRTVCALQSLVPCTDMKEGSPCGVYVQQGAERRCWRAGCCGTGCW